MSSVALISYDVQSVGGHAGGVGAFVSNFARLLRSHGERVTIVFVTAATSATHVDDAWRERYAAWGVQVLEVHTPAAGIDRWAEAWPARLSERLWPHLAAFDIVYVQDWANPGFHAIRRQRFSPSASPVLVTVLHGPSRWVRYGNRKLPDIPADVQIEFIERYSAEHSDWVIAPSRYMAGWLQQDGWRFRREPEVLGLPYLPESYDAGRPSGRSLPAAASAGGIERLVFFGRLENRKGFEIFADALRLVCARLVCADDARGLEGLKEIVLLGKEQEPGSVARLGRILAITGVPVVHLAGLDSASARSYLEGHAADALVVIPSPFENFPYAVIEALSIPGLNVICSRGGGIPEVFGSGGDAQLFEPSAPALAARLGERLRTPLRPEQLATYDSRAANARWMDFHRLACSPRPMGSKLPNARRPSVDVCIPYYNKGRYLGQALAALTAQTEKSFGVIVIDDGSTDTQSRAVFDAARSEYENRGWTFLRQENAFVDAARNRAARLSRADYLLFLDADDIPTPNAIECMLDGALASGVDCLLAGGWLFDSEEARDHSKAVGYMPLGPDLVGGMADPVVLGLSMILIRREVLVRIGGYRECRGAGHEDWELQIRLLLAGCQTDVLPEHLLFFRQTSDGLTRTGEAFRAKLRLIETYNRPLREAGMCGLAAAVVQLTEQCRELQDKLIASVPLALRMQFHESRQRGASR